MEYKSFIEDVKMRLRSMSKEDLDDLILNWASEEYPSKRQEFLAKLMPQKQEKQVAYNAGTLMKEIEGFTKRVANGKYCDGWGWDNSIGEERDWGDESWTEEMDEFFLQARSLLFQGENQLAEEIYRKLLGVLDMGQEPGHLPGDPDYGNMLKVDMDEQVALFVRSVYMNAAPEERPALLYEAINKYQSYAPKIGLKNIIDSIDTQLPGMDTFLTDWIEFLTKQTAMNSSELLREAVIIQGGIPAISAFAREHADRYPKAYLDWIGLLEMEDDGDLVIQVAREGLTNIPRDYKIRAEIAEVIVNIGKKLDDNPLKLEGYRECFYSNPSIKYLLDLYLTAIECDRFEEIQNEAEQRITKLRTKSRMPVNYYYDSECSTSLVSDAVIINSMLLGGRYDKVFEMCKGKGPVGWSSSENPQPVFITFMMVVLSKEGIYKKILYEQWDKAILNTCKYSYYANSEYIEKYRKLASIIKEGIQLTREQEESYLKWCKKEIGKRVDAIVSNKYRGSYHKAAGLLVAMAEVLANRGEKDAGVEFVQTHKSKYSRHRAFQSEVSQVLHRSGLIAGRISERREKKSR